MIPNGGKTGHWGVPQWEQIGARCLAQRALLCQRLVASLSQCASAAVAIRSSGSIRCWRAGLGMAYGCFSCAAMLAAAT